MGSRTFHQSVSITLIFVVSTTTANVALQINAEKSLQVPNEMETLAQGIYIPPPIPCDGNPCFRNNCTMVGYCREYFICNETTHTWQSINCGEDLFWNEKAVNGVSYGGSCDFFLNLPATIQQYYEHDWNCIPPCAWWQEDEDECTSKYYYRKPFDKVTLKNRTLTLQCPKMEANQLIWVQNTLSCERCENAIDFNDKPCTCK